MKFPIPPEYCLIINAFNRASSLRAAAGILNVDPPTLVRKVRIISSEYGYLEKIGNRWVVTEAGRRVAQWTDEMIQSQSELIFEKSPLRISSFAWLAEEMLIPEYVQLKPLFKHRYDCSFKITASNHEQELLQSRTDLVIQGHAPTDPSIAYKKLGAYNWVVVIPYSWKNAFIGKSKQETQELLNKKPFVRNANLNPENALGFVPAMSADLSADGVIGIRSAVVHEEGWSVLPAMSVLQYLKNKKIYKIDLETHIKDEVSLWWIRSRKDMSSIAKIILKWMSEFKI
jgi:DNA-binding transcriptional LysR family regulator